EVLEEIELLYMTPKQRRKKNWFPFIIIQKNWKGYKKPYFSDNLKEVLLLPVEQPDLILIEEKIAILKKSQDKIIQDLKSIKDKKNLFG
ncbi:4834_t:CDS:2, partial [Scutellospora calospora]